ncbi:sialate O-acetylesterase [Aggregatimonas sangjinii]|uniref:Sialate O-acetylesterase n=1 Tax=Aggregatimonas sangjinii TaxID=2583587 RepID=A0A5B7SLR8_9FLAO|nr:sialate O-acetylesterase [Aggregatimonas sangjinii]QCW99535.1 sialate O-acetylesterase [Aggregatimonas sangjinii]
MKRINIGFFLVLGTTFFTIASAQTGTPSCFGNDMLLQQNDTIAIWGHDKPDTPIKLTTSWGAISETSTNKEGKWRTTLPTVPASFKKHSIDIQGSSLLRYENILLGELWFVSGQSNMEMPVKGFKNSPVDNAAEFLSEAKNPNIRLFNSARAGSLQPQDTVNGSWVEADSADVANFSAVGYLFAKKLFDSIQVPVGIIEAAWGGTKIEAWIPKDSLAKFSAVTIPETSLTDASKRKRPTEIYNGMIAPFRNFTIKGFLWYQGESNRNQPEAYKAFQHTLVNSWRAQWQDTTLPFYLVQIAPYAYEKHRETPAIKAALLREAQSNSAREITNSGIAITTDVGDCDDIHPAKKEPIADRLVRLALNRDYGFKKIDFLAPTFSAIEIKGNTAMVKFEKSPTSINEHFVLKEDSLSGFAIAGSDQIFYPAKAIIKDDLTIAVSSSQVKEPIAVRYGFEDCYEGNLYSSTEIPIGPFRSDSW